MRATILILFMMMVGFSLNAQRTDSVMSVGSITGDTTWIITENKLKHTFFGNSWYTGISYNFSRSSEYAINIGRTYGKSFCGGGGCYMSMRSWGLGYALTYRDGIRFQTIHAFAEWAAFPFPPAGLRAEYLYDLGTGQSYFRPSVGLSLMVLDIFYNHSFLLSSGSNNYRHGVVIRLKYYLRTKNWENSYPRKC